MCAICWHWLQQAGCPMTCWTLTAAGRLPSDLLEQGGYPLTCFWASSSPCLCMCRSQSGGWRGWGDCGSNVGGPALHHCRTAEGTVWEWFVVVSIQWTGLMGSNLLSEVQFFNRTCFIVLGHTPQDEINWEPTGGGHAWNDVAHNNCT